MTGHWRILSYVSDESQKNRTNRKRIAKGYQRDDRRIGNGCQKESRKTNFLEGKIFRRILRFFNVLVIISLSDEEKIIFFQLWNDISIT